MVVTETIDTMIDNNGADPWVTKVGDDYYYIKVIEGKIEIFKSENITDLSAKEGVAIIEDTSEVHDFWAPELHYIDNSWYVYVAATTMEDDIHRMYVLSNENENPLEGEWKCAPMKGMDNKFAIDGTVLDIPSGKYFIWSGWEIDENVQQNLYLAEMITPDQVKEEKILISQPEFEWEKNGRPLINEGPQVVVKENTINLLYSASGSWTDDYCLGLLMTKVSSDVKDPKQWTKELKPVFQKSEDIYGPGHSSFTVSKNEAEDIMVYHSARWAGAGWNRAVRYQRVEFDSEGKLKESVPYPSDEKHSIPSGEPKRTVYKAQKVDKGWKFDVNSKKDGEFSAIIYGKIEDSFDEKNIIFAEIHVSDDVLLKKMYPSEYMQPLGVTTQLKKGNNEIYIYPEIEETILIDRIEILE